MVSFTSSASSPQSSVGSEITIIVVASMAIGGAIGLITVIIVAVIVGRRRTSSYETIQPDDENGVVPTPSMTKRGKGGTHGDNFVPMPAPNREEAWQFTSRWVDKKNAVPLIDLSPKVSPGGSKKAKPSLNQVQPLTGDDEVELLEDIPLSSPVESPKEKGKKTRKQRARAFQEIEELPDHDHDHTRGQMDPSIALMDALADGGLDYEETARWSNNLTQETMKYLEQLRQSEDGH